jgi:hypothetical protein
MKVHLEGTPEEIQEFLKKQGVKAVPSLEGPEKDEPIKVLPEIPIPVRGSRDGKPWLKEEDAIVLAEYKPEGMGKKGENKGLAKRMGRTYASVGWRYAYLIKHGFVAGAPATEKKPIDLKTQKLLSDWNALKSDFNKRSQEFVTVRNKPWKREEIKRVREAANTVGSLGKLEGLEKVFDLSKELGRTFFSVLGQVSRRR